MSDTHTHHAAPKATTEEAPEALPLPLTDVTRSPSPGDNVVIATRRLEQGTLLTTASEPITLPHTVMEGHRLAIKPIKNGEALHSWGLPFGVATRSISAGDYLCNDKILETLAGRRIDFELPAQPNFKDDIRPYHLNKESFQAGVQIAAIETPGTFLGYPRGGKRGVGTRNFIVILGTSSRTASFAKALAARFEHVAASHANIDGVVAIAHTEGGGETAPNNRDLLLRTLAGFMTHSNVGAILAVDSGEEAVTNEMLQQFMAQQHYPTTDLLHHYLTLSTTFDAALQQAEQIVQGWLPVVNAVERSEQPLRHLKLALQCGGSDSFSGISGNPLAGWVAKALIRHQGAAVLAETDELIGAESYVLSNVKSLSVAERFLEKIAQFKERAAWHGHSAEANPSGGNQYRGLYNIVLKSIGAARKKDPEVRLDAVLDYGQPMTESGYYFMDSPGNDLESIAGQVASGSNAIIFITGNGSITNFPFVPTLKFVTTTARWSMLAHEMDVNAGRYLDGESMDALGAETFDQLVNVASGQRSLGEKAGHFQVSIWRDWKQSSDQQLTRLQNAPIPNGSPLSVIPPTNDGWNDEKVFQYQALQTEQGVTSDQVGLVVPTSLCSGQIARLIAERLNEDSKGKSATETAVGKLSKYVALVHTEGCGAAPGYSEQLYLRTVLGHLKHPMVSKALLLEHGCEKTHNDAMRQYMEENGVDVSRLGFASVQMDGGLEAVMEKSCAWFDAELKQKATASAQPMGLEGLALGLTGWGTPDETFAKALALLARGIVQKGGLVVIPSNASLWQTKSFANHLLVVPQALTSTLGYGEPTTAHGLHVMDAPTDHGVETLTGLAACGVEVMLAQINGAPRQAHPMVPLVQASADPHTIQRFGQDIDVILEMSSNAAAGMTQPHDAAQLNDTARQAAQWQETMLDKLLQVLSRQYVPKVFGKGNTDFQLTRGWLGFSV